MPHRACFVAFLTCALLGPFARLSAQTAHNEEPVQLPPFIVEERVAGPSWRYARGPGFEILTRCHDTKSRALAESFFRAHQAHRALLPRRFEMQLDVPIALIFYDENLWPIALQESAAAFLGVQNFSFRQARASPGDPTPLDRWLGRHAPGDSKFNRWLARPDASPSRTAASNPTAPKPHTFITDLRLSDADSIHIFTLAPDGHGHLFRTYLRPTYLAQLLAGRTPSLPSWFLTGFLNLYGQMEFGGDTITLSPLVWLSPDENTAARRDAETATRHFLPIVDLLNESAAATAARAPREHHIALAQLDLFLRWAFDPRTPDRRDRFWSLVERACSESVTPELIATTLGIDAHRLDDELAAFLPDAVRNSPRWDIPALTYPDFEFRPASAAEIARLRGDWERLEARYAAIAAPHTVEKYRHQSLRTLRHAFDRGEHDPALVATLGLAELDAGNFDSAREHLTFATHQRVVRPTAYIELARLQLQHHLAPSAYGRSHLSPAQAREITQLLRLARDQHPLLPDIFRIAAEAWNACETAPTPDDLAFLLEAPTHFPRSAEFCYHAARFAVAAGDTSRAKQITANALRLGASDTSAPRLAELHATLTR